MFSLIEKQRLHFEWLAFEKVLIVSDRADGYCGCWAEKDSYTMDAVKNLTIIF